MYAQSLKRLLHSQSTPKLGLERMRELLALLDNPQEKMKVFHVAGTNGKGSTCAYLESMLRKSGYKTGLFTSPHLLSARERIRFNGELISEADFCEAEERVEVASAQMTDPPSFFERILAMAVLYFAKENVDAFIAEVGLGGRLDATNVLSPVVCGISRIALDHTGILGDSLSLIAKEKAGIMKSGCMTITSEQELDVLKVIRERATSLESALEVVGEDILVVVSEECVFIQDRFGNELLPKTFIPLIGKHQYENVALAVAMIEHSDFDVSAQERKAGIEETKWPGRYETVSATPFVILDGAHNLSGLKTLFHALEADARIQNKPMNLVIGMTMGHNMDEMVNEIARFSQNKIVKLFMTQSLSPRSVHVKILEEQFQKVKLGNEIDSIKGNNGVHHVVCAALKEATENDAFVVVAGSLFVVGEARGIFLDMPKDPDFPAY